MKHEGSQPGRPSAPRPTSRGSERSQSQQAQLVEGGSGAQAQARAHPNYGGVEEASDRWLEHRRRSHPTNLFAKATGEGASHGRNAFSGPLTPPRTGRDKDRDQDGHRRQARELPSPSSSATPGSHQKIGKRGKGSRRSMTSHLSPAPVSASALASPPSASRYVSIVTSILRSDAAVDSDRDAGEGVRGRDLESAVRRSEVLGVQGTLGNFGGRRGAKRSLTALTVAFVLVSLYLQGRGVLEDTDDADGGGQVPTRGDDAAVYPQHPDFDSATASQLSCGAYSVSLPVMKMHNSSTASELHHAAVSSDSEVCSRLGTNIMRDMRGNAVDAAVATVLCLGVVNPASSGLGGGAFILVHSNREAHLDKLDDDNYISPAFVDMTRTRTQSKGEGSRQRRKAADNGGHGRGGTKMTEFIDCRETAPYAATHDMYEHLPPEASLNGALAAAIPGELRGLELLHSRHGRIPWSDVVKPAMDLARNGVEVSPYLARAIQRYARNASVYPSLTKILTKNGDGETWLQEGDLLQRQVYADTLREVMKDGADAMYNGRLAALLEEEVKDAGGIITKKDLEMYQPILRDPLVADEVSGFTMVGAPPPSSGGASIIGAARFLAGYKEGMGNFPDTLAKHRLVEAFKHVFAIRMSMSDPAFSQMTDEAVNDLIKGYYIDGLRNETLDNGTLPPSQYGGRKWAQLLQDGNYSYQAEDAHEGDRRRLRFFNYLEDKGTTHLNVVDEEMNAVAITSSINTNFGSKFLSQSTGIVLNNEMDDFSTPGRSNKFGVSPSSSNYIVPGKRPLSSMSPTMVFHRSAFQDNSLGRLFMVLGSSGGPKIITSVLQVLINHAWLGMPLYSAVAHARIHDQLLYHGNLVTLYDQCPLLQGPTIEVAERTRKALERRGHSLLPVDYLGTTQAISVDFETDLLTAVSDPRKGGIPAGY